MNLGNLYAVFRPACLALCLFSTAAQSQEGGIAMSMSLNSNDFTHNAAIPRRFTCQGEDVSPELNWSTLPANTKSLVLIVDDPDAPDPVAPKITWVHWLLYNIPATVKGLPGNMTATRLPAGTLQGKNGWNLTGYKGPCPPMGAHRYFFKLYALDIVLADLREPDKKVLEQAMAGHVAGYAELVGIYRKD